MMTDTPSTEDRIWTVLSHLAALSLGIGILLPIVGWSDQRGKSKYASFQCLQALGYQSLGFTVWLLTYLVALAAVLLYVVARSYQAEKNGMNFNPLQGPGIIMYGVLFGLFALYCIPPIFAAAACALGKDFRYPLMGDRLAQYLEYGVIREPEEQTWLNEDHELRWVAAAGHFSVLIFIWGMLAPLTTWIVQGRQNLFLKFQSVQALVYQALTTIIAFVGAFFYGFGLFFLLISMGGIDGAGFDPFLSTPTIVIFGVSLFIALILLLSVPLLHILGQWAGYRVLKGDNYRYPLLGRWMERRIAGNSILKEKSL